jgi:hypothetical protein
VKIAAVLVALGLAVLIAALARRSPPTRPGRSGDGGDVPAASFGSDTSHCGTDTGGHCGADGGGGGGGGGGD